MLHKIKPTPELIAELQRRRIFFVLAPGAVGTGSRLTFPDGARIEPYAHLVSLQLPFSMGAFSYSRSKLDESVTVGRYCSIAPDVRFTLESHPVDWVTTSPALYGDGYMIETYARDRGAILASPSATAPRIEHTEIGNDVWIGAGAIIRSGVKIGDGAIIGAGAVVVRNVPPYAVVGGVPAKVIRYRFPDDIVSRMKAAAWWRFAPDVLRGLTIDDPEAFLDTLEQNVQTLAPAGFGAVTSADLLAISRGRGT
jgi:acetyltransferase-like isoleucine patch superfamily enzyme